MKPEYTDIEKRAVDIVLADDITQQQLEAIDGSEELRDCVQDALDLRSAVRQRHEPVDVEAALRRFHAHMDDDGGHAGYSPRPTRHYALWMTLIATAAVFVAAVVMVDRLFPKQEAKSPYLFTATAQDGISLSTENGDEATLSPRSKQNTSLTLDDFRQIFSDESRIKEVTLTVPIGKSADITLPDSSKVYLSPGSRLTFPVVFNEDKRVVKLDGMGYFKVTHNTARPFIVMTDKTETTVLGTEFTVSSTTGDVALVSGSVCVKATASGQTVTIRPEQKVHFTDGGKAEITTVDTTPLTAWRDGYLYFDNVELRDIMLAIGANFNKNIDIRSRKAQHYRMRFITERNNGVQAAIDMMNRMEKVKVSLHDNTIVVEDI